VANSFTKEERVAFDDILMGFNDALVISKNVAKYGTKGELMERTNDVIYRPMPYIMNSQNRTVGPAVTAMDATQLKVPATLGYKKNVTWNLNALELRDQLNEGRLGKSAYQRLASDLNTSVRDVASLQGTLVVPVTGAAGDYDDVALAESLMLEQGIDGERCLALTARDYNGIAGNLSTATRSFGNKKSDDAYERSYVGPIAGFETFKLDSGKRITAAAAGGSITVATNGAQVRYAPTATADNRTQSVTFSSTTGMVAGDCFTIAGIEAVHHITKESTGQLKTFRVESVTSGTVAVISPPMIGANSSPTDAEVQYKNINVASTSGTAAVVWLNANATNANPFWVKDSIEILPGRYAVPSDQGVNIMRGVTDQGIEVVMGKSFSNSTFVAQYTLDIFYGVVNCNPEQNGIILFNQ
jgi:uncharacterized protein YdbL (DUF1318 family)